MLTIQESGKIIGTIVLKDINQKDRRGEIGYWITQSAGGKGITTKACSALIRYSFEALQLHRIEIRVAPENIRSQAIPKRLGFTHEGTLKEVSSLNGRFIDLEIWRLLEIEWRKNL